MPNSLAFNNETLLYNNQYELYYFNPYNPLDLPPNTVRVRTSDGNPPIKGANTTYSTATLVTGTTDVYDVYKSGTKFTRFLYDATNVIEVLGANTIGITNMYYMFSNCTSLTSVNFFDTSSVTSMASMFSDCTSLTSVPLFNTSNVTTIETMFYGCTSLTSIPLFDTSKVTSMYYTFYNCYKVQSGALALYQQASTQTKPPNRHERAFGNCGRDTVTGAAELAQIPADWK